MRSMRGVALEFWFGCGTVGFGHVGYDETIPIRQVSENLPSEGDAGKREVVTMVEIALAVLAYSTKPHCA